MRNVTAAFRAAIFGSQTDQVFLSILTLSHPGLAADVAIVANRQPITSNGVTYQPFAFAIDLPSDREGRVTGATLVIDNVDRTIVQAVRSINQAPTVSVVVVLASDPDVIEVGPFEFALRNVSYDAETVRGDLFFQERLEKEIPRDRMIARDFPGLFL